MMGIKKYLRMMFSLPTGEKSEMETATTYRCIRCGQTFERQYDKCKDCGTPFLVEYDE